MRTLHRRLDRIEAAGGPPSIVFVWVNADDTQADIAAKIEERKAAFPGERLDIHLVRWLRAGEVPT